MFTTTPGVPRSEASSRRARSTPTGPTCTPKSTPTAATTEYHFEYVDDENFQESDSLRRSKPLPGRARRTWARNSVRSAPRLTACKAETIYHYRAVAHELHRHRRAERRSHLQDLQIRLRRFLPQRPRPAADRCRLLLDCRAYELASAHNAGGYDVESDLIPGQTPFGDYPLAIGPLEAALRGPRRRHPGDRTDHQSRRRPLPRDPRRRWLDDALHRDTRRQPIRDRYFRLHRRRSRLESGHVSGSADPSPALHASPTAPPEYPSGSRTGAGPGDGGSLDPGPGAEPSGHIGKHLSADGSHFVFGSTSQFEPDGNSNGDVSIYDRNLISGETHVVSKTPEGER